jgi:hypothetical protein
MQLIIKVFNDISKIIDVDKTWSIMKLKEKLYANYQIPVNKQYLVYLVNGGRILDETQTIEYYNMTENSTITCNMKLN